MLRAFKIPLTWTELFKRTYTEINQDNALGLAAQLAYYFLLGLVPAIVCVLALTSFLPPNTLNDFMQSLSGFAPPDVVQILRDQLTSLRNGDDSGALTVGLLLAVWSTSAAMVSIIDALNRAYDIDEGRPWWKVRLTAILLTIGVAVFIVVALALVMAGPGLVNRFASMIGLGPTFAAVWNVLRWPVSFALVSTCIGIIYYFAADAEQEWEWITPGAVLATILWLLASLGFKFYVASFGSYGESYGSLGGVIVLMLWFYISALAVLTGAELNAEIEHASPYGKAPGEKVPGQKRKIGAAARRAWEERMTGQEVQPSPAPALRPAVASSPAMPKRGFAAYAVLGLGLLSALRKKRSPAGS